MTRPRGAASCAVMAIIVILLAGCAGTPDLTANAATRLQADVQAVTQSSADGDIPGARAALDTLTRHVTSARASGDLSVRRTKQIEASIELVSTDLTVSEQEEQALATANQAANRRAAAARAAAARAAAKAAALRAAATTAPATATPRATATATPQATPTAPPQATPPPGPQPTPGPTHT